MGARAVGRDSGLPSGLESEFCRDPAAAMSPAGYFFISRQLQFTSPPVTPPDLCALAVLLVPEHVMLSACRRLYSNHHRTVCITGCMSLHNSVYGLFFVTAVPLEFANDPGKSHVLHLLPHFVRHRRMKSRFCCRWAVLAFYRLSVNRSQPNIGPVSSNSRLS